MEIRKNKKNRRQKFSELIGDRVTRLAFQLLFLIIFILFTCLAYFTHIEFLNKLTTAFMTAFFMAVCITCYEIISGSNNKYKSDMSCMKCNGAGLKDIKHSRSEIKLDKLLESCKKGDDVRILLVSLQSLEHMQGAFEECSRNGANIEICVYTPAKADTYLESRAFDERIETIFEKMYSGLSTFLQLNDRLENKMDIRVSYTRPSTVLFSINSDCFVPFMLYHKFSNEFIHLHFCLNDHANQKANLFKEHFEKFFDDADRITLKELEAIKDGTYCVKDAKQTKQDFMDKHANADTTAIDVAVSDLKDLLTSSKMREIEFQTKLLQKVLQETITTIVANVNKLEKMLAKVNKNEIDTQSKNIQNILTHHKIVLQEDETNIVADVTELKKILASIKMKEINKQSAELRTILQDNILNQIKSDVTKLKNTYDGIGINPAVTEPTDLIASIKMKEINKQSAELKETLQKTITAIDSKIVELKNTYISSKTDEIKNKSKDLREILQKIRTDNNL
jgi:hypothetical protein